MRYLYQEAKKSIWTALTPALKESIPAIFPISTHSIDRQDYVYHPESGEKLSSQSVHFLETLRDNWGSKIPQVQIIL